uniref:Si:ch211-102c2.8 n=1 Tax=Stegastes partitus TaxID=144197 RepID=A0A3B5A1D6_9TELE
VIQLRKSLQQQREEAETREKELHVDTLEKVHKAVEEERRKHEAEKVEAVQVHCGILEAQHSRSLESLRSEMQQEKSKALVLQHQVVELKTRVQELENESCAQQREQESLLAVICKSLKEEHQAELQRSQRHMAKKHFISHLHQELKSQKQTNEELRKDKERELSIQRHQLRMERDQALNAIKERLIQEHIEELSSLKWAHLTDGGAEGGGGGGGVAASLRKQLKAKDLELRQVQRNMAEWKEQTAARLACKFEEELTVELEDVTSFKLLRYLQSRVKQLRVENQ